MLFVEGIRGCRGVGVVGVRPHHLDGASGELEDGAPATWTCPACGETNKLRRAPGTGGIGEQPCGNELALHL